MIEQILMTLKNNIKKRIWIFSDLQQSLPDNSRYCLTRAVEDFNRLEMPCERIWYLGDAVEGYNLDFLNEMSDMQKECLNPLGVPVRYVLGNHDFDFYQHHKASLARVVLPFYEAVRNDSSWKTTNSIDSFYFIEEMEDLAVVFLSDHADPSGKWLTTHGNVQGDTTQYPYSDKEYLKLNSVISSFQKPVITVSHYAFAGGNRPADLLSRLLPLPENVIVHFYGHAHIGDKYWAGKDCFRKIACIDNQSIPQVNVSSLENFRGNAIRSVFLEIYKDNSFGIYFRNHTTKRWEEYLLIENI